MEGIIERDNWEALEYFYQYPEPNRKFISTRKRL